MAWENSQERRFKITVKASMVDGALSDFPVFVGRASVPDEQVSPTDANAGQSDGGDFRVATSDDGTGQLALEVVSWELDSTDGGGDAVLESHFKATSLSDTVDNEFWGAYKTSGTTSQPAVGDTHGRNAVWSDYAAVYHGDDTTDATGNGNTLTLGTNCTAGNSDTPFGSGSLDFDTTDIITAALSVTLTSSWTLQASVIWDSFANDPIIYGWNEAGTSHNLGIGELTGNHKVFSSGETPGSGAAISTSTWYHSAERWDGTDVTSVLNGSQDYSRTPSGSGWQNSDELALGGNPTNQENANGRVDEVRARQSWLSTDWLAAEYRNQYSPATYVTAGTPEDTGAGGGVTYPQLERGIRGLNRGLALAA